MGNSVGRMLIFWVFSGGGGGEGAAGPGAGEAEGEGGPGARHPQRHRGQAGAGAQGERGERVSQSWWGERREIDHTIMLHSLIINLIIKTSDY